MELRKCVFCKKDTTNTKYCSRKCAITVNNTLKPKRERTLVPCKKCGNPFWAARSKYCDECRRTHVRFGMKSDDYKSLTLQHFIDKYDKTKHHASWKMSEVRYFTRTWNAHRPRVCEVCGYDKHIEYAHIQALSKLPPTTTLWEANSEANIAILCPNHHWEFDNGHLTLSGRQESNLRSLSGPE